MEASIRYEIKQIVEIKVDKDTDVVMDVNGFSEINRISDFKDSKSIYESLLEQHKNAVTIIREKFPNIQLLY